MKKIGLLLLALFTFTQLMAALPLAKNGNAAAEIVVPANADKVISYAAQELQYWVEKISGARLPVVTAVNQDKNQIILDPAASKFTADAARLKDNDGYSVRQQDNKVYINGSSAKGVLNGVYRMLYKNSDIIWARPQEELGTIYTPDKNLTLTKTDYIDIPKFVLRGWQMPRRAIHNHVWQVRNATNWNTANDEFKHKSGAIMEFGGGHNIIGTYITERKYFKTHPEYFPLKNGKRLRPSKHKGSVQLCFTNNNMYKDFIKEVDSRVKKNPHFTTYRIMIEDNYNLCECPECIKPIKLADGIVVDKTDRAFRSTQFFMFLNKIALHFKKNYPGKRILTFAYFFTVIPPKCRVEDNVDISFCPISKNSKFPITAPASKKTMDQFTGWNRITPNITWREYFGLCGDFPRPIDAVAFADWQYVYNHGVRRTYSEMRGDAKYGSVLTNSWDTNSMYFWVLTQGSWDPFQDYKALRMEFLTRVYGKAAAPHIAKYYSIIEKRWFKLPGRSIWNDVAITNWRNHILNDAKTIAACRAALKQAEGKVKPNGRKLFALLKDNFEKQLSFESSKVVSAKRTSGEPGFDPEFSSAAWASAPIADQFFHNTGLKAHPDKTEVRLLYDDTYIYIGVKCEHSDVKNMKYRSYAKGEKRLPNGEGFEVFITGGWTGKNNVAHMIIDPAGNRYFSGRKVRWKGEVQITDFGWSALFTVPWKDLKLTPGQKTKGQFVRQFKRTKKDGKLPWTAAILFSGRRRLKKYFCEIEFK